MAVQLLGHKPVTTLDNADDMVTSASQFYDLLLPSILSTGNWRFATTISQLSLSSQIPPLQTNWQNIYLLPSGYLKNIRIIPNNYVYEIYANSQIWCNWGTQTEVFMEYAFMPDVAQLTPSFVNYFIYEIAIVLAPASAQKPDYMAILEKKRLQQWAIAQSTDAQNRPQYSQADLPVLDRRNITGIIGPQIG